MQKQINGLLKTFRLNVSIDRKRSLSANSVDCIFAFLFYPGTKPSFPRPVRSDDDYRICFRLDNIRLVVLIWEYEIKAHIAPP